MDAPNLAITLIRAPDDPPLNAPSYQAALREFEQALTSHGLEVSYTLEVRESWAPEPIPALYLGDFFIQLAGHVGAPVIAGIAGWLTGRSGRKFRLKVGDIEVEAPTIQAVESLIARAQEIQQANQPKVIHEP